MVLSFAFLNMQWISIIKKYVMYFIIVVSTFTYFLFRKALPQRLYMKFKCCFISVLDLVECFSRPDLGKLESRLLKSHFKMSIYFSFLVKGLILLKLISKFAIYFFFFSPNYIGVIVLIFSTLEIKKQNK